ncbi:hypothetical protein J3L11_17145 [Shewanella sp. 4t3-1-2LB]|uniref:TorF family putative porin n=1 Tax=Shewanella sp. 4t3-1-2LB TaxID=2817682 RepID=UPI001A986988|nr:TorF family putative porin [Shewanella sp. 4t3-1-2LB]MBO1273366.1 hypothetical protein [Shewanella sp. 4t3-1-2LB]
MNLFNRHKIRTYIAIAVTLDCGSTLADVSGNVALTSDYVFRGFSQTEGDPAIQGGFDVAYDNGLYAGVWASNVESDPSAPVNYNGANMETDIYGGWAGNFDALSLEIGYLRYQYPGTKANVNNTDEFHLGAGYETSVVSTTLNLHYSPDYFGADKAFYWDLGIDVPLPKNIIFTAHYGLTDYQDNSLGDDYVDWCISFSTEWNKLRFVLSYINTAGITDTCDNNVCAERFVLSVSRSL